MFEQVAPEAEATPDTNGEPARNQDVRTDILSVNALELENIHISFRDQGEEPLVFAMESARGSAPLGEPMELSMLGILLEEPFTLKVKADSLGDFLAMTRSRLGMRLENGLMTAEQLAVRGKFDDFRIGMKTGVLSLGTTATKFVISPITTPFKRLFKEDLPEDGALPRSTLLSEV